MTALLSLDVVILTTIACLIASAFYSGTETGLMSVSRIRLRVRDDVETLGLRSLLQNVEDPIITCLIGTNLFNVLASTLVTAALTLRYGRHSELISVAVMSVLVITFGELIPKIVYREYPESMTLMSLRPLRWSMFVFAPARWVLLGYSRLISALIPSHLEAGAYNNSRAAMALMLRSENNHGGGDQLFDELLERCLRLEAMNLSALMTPVSRIVSLPRTASLADCRATAAISGFSRLPVYGEDSTKPVGWLLARDLLFLEEEVEWDGIPATSLRTCPWVQRDLSPWALYEEMRWQKQQVAMVADQDGQWVGLVTLEDLLEILVGSIEDEFDRSWRGPVVA